MIDRKQHDSMANAIRALAMDAVEKAKSGHPGLPMGAADIATVLFSRFLKFNAADPQWADRDRFILSAGHGSMLLYALLYLTGTPGVTLDEIKNFRQLGSRTAGHPEYGHTPGVEVTTGPLGQGIANAVGFALAEKMLANRYGKIVDHFTYVLAGDGCLMEGISQEAISLAGHLKLNKLIVLWDDNGISIDGPISVSDSTDQHKRFQASGWNTLACDGHDPEAIATAIEKARNSDKPTMIACKTTIGFGSPKKADTNKAHGEPLGAEELLATKEKLGWSHGPFEIPQDILSAWRATGARGAQAQADWNKALAGIDSAKKAEFERQMKGELPQAFDQAVRALKEKLAAEKPVLATRKSSELALETYTEAVPELVLGSADLTGSNNTKTKNISAVTPEDFSGRYIHYGIREHGMAAALNGLALHGGFIPSGATFLVFADYCRPSIRLSALMNQRVIYVMTHDSIGLGEDGPTHQPVEHLASLRAIPNLLTLRPADAMETAESWELALRNKNGPTVLALTRQNLDPVRVTADAENKCARGAYILADAANAQVVLFASGSEVAIALAAQKQLADEGIAARVVSVPSLETFLKQDAAYRASLTGTAKAKVAIEAGIRMGWDAVIGADGAFVGMHSFGASAPIKALYAHFGITPEAAVAAAKALL